MECGTLPVSCPKPPVWPYLNVSPGRALACNSPHTRPRLSLSGRSPPRERNPNPCFPSFGVSHATRTNPPPSSPASRSLIVQPELHPSPSAPSQHPATPARMAHPQMTIATTAFRKPARMAHHAAAAAGAVASRPLAVKASYLPITHPIAHPTCPQRSRPIRKPSVTWASTRSASMRFRRSATPRQAPSRRPHSASSSMAKTSLAWHRPVPARR